MLKNTFKLLRVFRWTTPTNYRRVAGGSFSVAGANFGDDEGTSAEPMSYKDPVLMEKLTAPLTLNTMLATEFARRVRALLVCFFKNFIGLFFRHSQVPSTAANAMQTFIQLRSVDKFGRVTRVKSRWLHKVCAQDGDEDRHVLMALCRLCVVPWEPIADGTTDDHWFVFCASEENFGFQPT
jgi:hypothetical protein